MRGAHGSEPYASVIGKVSGDRVVVERSTQPWQTAALLISKSLRESQVANPQRVLDFHAQRLVGQSLQGGVPTPFARRLAKKQAKQFALPMRAKLPPECANVSFYGHVQHRRPYRPCIVLARTSRGRMLRRTCPAHCRSNLLLWRFDHSACGSSCLFPEESFAPLF
jgi:hypothetical protein